MTGPKDTFANPLFSPFLISTFVGVLRVFEGEFTRQHCTLLWLDSSSNKWKLEHQEQQPEQITEAARSSCSTSETTTPRAGGWGESVLGDGSRTARPRKPGTTRTPWNGPVCCLCSPGVEHQQVGLARFGDVIGQESQSKKWKKAKAMKWRRQAENVKFHRNIFRFHEHYCLVSFHPSSQKSQVRYSEKQEQKNKLQIKKQPKKNEKFFVVGWLRRSQTKFLQVSVGNRWYDNRVKKKGFRWRFPVIML